jgi:hypothetical protein
MHRGNDPGGSRARYCLVDHPVDRVGCFDRVALDGFLVPSWECQEEHRTTPRHSRGDGDYRFILRAVCFKCRYE